MAFDIGPAQAPEESGGDSVGGSDGGSGDGAALRRARFGFGAGAAGSTVWAVCPAGAAGPAAASGGVAGAAGGGTAAAGAGAAAAWAAQTAGAAGGFRRVHHSPMATPMAPSPRTITTSLAMPPMPGRDVRSTTTKAPPTRNTRKITVAASVIPCGKAFNAANGPTGFWGT